MSDVLYALTINGARAFTEQADPVIHPATEQTICSVPRATREHLDAAVNAAREAFRGWSRRPLAERQAAVSKLGELIEQNNEAFIRERVSRTTHSASHGCGMTHVVPAGAHCQRFLFQSGRVLAVLLFTLMHADALGPAMIAGATSIFPGASILMRACGVGVASMTGGTGW